MATALPQGRAVQPLEPIEQVPLPAAIKEEVEEAAKIWPQIVGQFNMPLKAYLNSVAKVTVSENNELELIYNKEPGSPSMVTDFLIMRSILKNLKRQYVIK